MQEPMQEPMLQALLAHVDEGVHVVDRHGTTILYNAQAGLNDGLRPEEVLGKHLLTVFPSLDAQSSTLLKLLKTGEAILNQEQTFANFKGLRVTTVNSTWPVFADGQLIAAIEISKDITRVRQLSEQVLDLQAELLGRRKGKGTARNDARYTFDDLVGEEPQWRQMKDQALRVAQGESAVLIYGETGTGKELLVHAIHLASSRRAGPLVAQNCAALPEGLLEGILLGTVKGSFTGAEDRAGLFELADGGTLYLDEINSMDRTLQAKLLRVLQDGRVRRLGDARERAVKVRVIASTNEEPGEAVQQRRIRPDLYYRLNVISLEMPPLRERRGDVPLLVQHFLRKHCRRGDQPTLSPEAERFFFCYGWPGNVRELEHAVEAGIQLTRGEQISLGDLPPHLQRAATAMGFLAGGGEFNRREVTPPMYLRGSLAAAEREAIRSALRDNGWNLTQAARHLGIPRQTLQYRMKLHEISRQRTGELA